MEQPTSAENTGTITIGSYVVQIGSVHGGVVNISTPEQQPQPRPRPTPVLLRPRSFPGFLDRRTEVDMATATLQAGQPVEFYGEAGLGKSALLRYLAYNVPTTSFPDGIIYLSAHRQHVADLLQTLFDAFHESDLSFKPTDIQIRHALQNKTALILLDDVDLTPDEIERLMEAASGFSFVLASRERRLWGKGQSIRLSGLPLNDALRLIEQELGRPLTMQDRTHAQALWTSLQGHPGNILQIVAWVREEGRSLSEVSEELIAQILALASLSEPEQQVLSALAAFEGTALSAEHLAILVNLSDPLPVLEMLLHRGLVQIFASHYSLTGLLSSPQQQRQHLTLWMERSLIHFTVWTERYRQNPDRLLEEAEAIMQTLEWAARTGNWPDVLRLVQVVEGAFALGKRWNAWAQMLQWGLQAAQILADRAAEAWALHQLGIRALSLGDAATAHTFLSQALHLRETQGDQIGAAITRLNMDLLQEKPMTKHYYLQNIRILLTAGFTSEELRRLCYDEADFRPVYDQLAPGTGKAEIVDRLLEYADRKLLLETLLVWTNEHNPARYKEHQPYYDYIAGPTISADTWREARRSTGPDTVVEKTISSHALRVFLCHSSTDKPAIRKLYHQLRADGCEPWLDEENLLPGEDWELEIRKAVQSSNVVIVCLSTRSVSKSGYVQKEIKYALDVAEEQPEGAIFLIPLKLEECEVPDRLRRWQWVKLFEERGYERLMRALRKRAEAIGMTA